ncbi:hypothetical protein H9Q13_15630 [Pontibacter sp. JH31]|uniref:Uncharacterized protein n=1 Tax=Pontibacter aquaedesilientis TaxID=2766980 RepID=A0ABR7XK20_9BACT|nr:hypothetical protein [Pontibacter aquaedesilientis]MBD1398603.1 hypothetical protein [Pontibacter aquaedesilientis]
MAAVLFIPIALEQNRKLDKSVLEVNAWHPNLEEHFPFPERNYREVSLTGNSLQDVPSIESAQAFIRQMYQETDTINGIRFIFQDSVSYGTYVGILNSFKIDSITYFAVYDNSIWVLNRPKPKEDTPYMFICGTSNLTKYYASSTYFDSYNDMSLSQKFEYHFTPYRSGAIKLWPALTLLLLLAILSMRQISSKSLYLNHPKSPSPVS